MLKTILFVLMPVLVFVGISGSSSFFSEDSATVNNKTPEGDTGTLEKLIVANASVNLSFDAAASARKNAKGLTSNKLTLDSEADAFFTSIVFNDQLRAILPSSMKITTSNPISKELILESLPIGGQYSLALRDGLEGQILFNIEGEIVDYNAAEKKLTISEARLLVSEENASNFGAKAGTVVGEFGMSASLRAIEVAQIRNGDVTESSLPPTNDPDQVGTTPGPDVVVGDLNGLAQFGSSANGQVGLAVGTDSCNFGTVNLNWLALPNNDHPVIPQNMYRMSGGAGNDLRFEQIGQSFVKHGFTALTQNLCGLGCNGVGGSQLGSGCSDPYVASLNAGPDLGSRAWINPFTGAYPRGDSGTSPNSHAGHNNHSGQPTAHKILTNITDLAPGQNPGAIFFAEAQYVTPHEYTWCQSNPSQCNMYNNVSYRRYNVSGTTSFSFTPAAATVRAKPAVSAWPGATLVPFTPAPGVDGRGTVAYKVTETSPGVWQYEYAVYNENLDRAIQMFSVPVGTGVTISNVGFHSPPQHPGWSGDGTVGNTGFSNAAWATSEAGGAITWSSETLMQNANANAIRWGTMYNFRFSSNRPPVNMNATVGFYKTGSPITVQVQGPSPSTSTTTASVSGVVLDQGGRGLKGAIVQITGPGVTRSIASNTFGRFYFDNITTGGPYTITVTAKRHTYASQQITLSNNLTGLSFTPAP